MEINLENFSRKLDKNLQKLLEDFKIFDKIKEILKKNILLCIKQFRKFL